MTSRVTRRDLVFSTQRLRGSYYIRSPAVERSKTMRSFKLGRLVVACTTALICFISYTPQFFIIWPWYGRELSIQLFNLLVPFKYDPCPLDNYRDKALTRP